MEELRMILSVYRNYAILKNRNNRVAGWLASILHRMGVVLMNKRFDFKDLMTFGLFILALLTFVFTFIR